MNQVYTYQKALLYSVKNLNMAIRDSQKLVEYLTLSSKYSNLTCDKITLQILRVIERRQKLIKLKNTLKKIVTDFTSDEKKLFAKKYLGRKLTFNDYSKRQYFRNQNKLLKTFAVRLNRYGLDEKMFKEEYLSIPYINSIYKVVEQKEGHSSS